MKRLLLLPACLGLLAMAQDSAVQLLPGQWEIAVRMTEIKLPGLSDDAAAQVRANVLNKVQTNSRCMTPAEVADPTASLASPGGNARGCTFTRQVFAGGVIDVAGTCPGPVPDGSRVHVTLAGTYSETGMNGALTANVEGGPLPMRMRGSLAGRHIGECRSS